MTLQNLFLDVIKYSTARSVFNLVFRVIAGIEKKGGFHFRTHLNFNNPL